MIKERFNDTLERTHDSLDLSVYTNFARHIYGAVCIANVLHFERVELKADSKLIRHIRIEVSVHVEKERCGLFELSLICFYAHDVHSKVCVKHPVIVLAPCLKGCELFLNLWQLSWVDQYLAGLIFAELCGKITTDKEPQLVCGQDG